MAGPICCVDQTRPGTRLLGGRWFCDAHYERAIYQRGRVWRSSALAVVGLLAFVVLVVALDAALRPDLTGPALMLVGVALALGPALLWLLFFYQQDRLEPEPIGQVGRVFIAGLALAGGIGIPLTDELFRVQDWLYRDVQTTVLGAIFVIGAIEAFTVYAAVRLFIYDSPEFDERVDGVVYATAAGLGYATALSLRFIVANGGAALGAGEVYVTEIALAQAAFAGVLGYFLGRAKLEHRPLWWLPTGLLVAAVLNGCFTLLRGQLEPGTVAFGTAAWLPSLGGLLLAGGLAVVVTALVAWLIRRDIAATLAHSGADERILSAIDAPSALIDDRRANRATIGLFAALLLVGTVAWNAAVNSTTAFDRDGLRGAYPAYYTDATREGELLRVVDRLGSGAEFAIVRVAGNAQAVAERLAAERGSDHTAYRVMRRSVETLNGRPALMERFGYVNAGGLIGAPPQVIEGVDYIFVQDGRAVVVTMLAPPEQIEETGPLFRQFLGSLSFY
ncbi:MAG TPA: PrsW family glutamic-type intramembrane protease [Roseiflexaceae bacterium]|nr:PrsW family glutamic-type intramembrane protease [Roseiflexaceae bacterium]